MAVLQREFNWSTYQDKQLKVLEQIEKHISRSVESSRVITDNMTKLSRSIENMVRSTNSLAGTIAILRGESAESIKNTREYNNQISKSTEVMEKFSERSSIIVDQYENTINTVDRVNRSLEDLQESADSAAHNSLSALDSLQDIGEEYKSILATSRDKASLMKEIESSVSEVSNNAKDIDDAIQTVIDRAKTSIEELDRSDSNYQKKVDRILAHTRGTIDGIFDRERDIAETREAMMNDLVARFKQIAADMAAMANTYSEASNHMIYLSGTSGEDIRKFREEIVGVVKNLNDTTGNFYSGEKAYSQIVAISQGVTSDLDTIKEMAPSLLLAQETLNLNTGSLADMFAKYYNKYNFNSIQMEEMLNGIRKNTAGNAANAQTTLENMNTLKDIVEFNAKGDKEKLANSNDQISKYTSWMESMHIDSKAYTQWMKDIAYGDFDKNPALVGMLNRGGLDSTSAQELVKSGNLGKVQQALMDGLVKTMDEVGVNDTVALGKVLDNLGLNRETAMETYNVAKYGKNYQSYDQFVASQDEKKVPDLRKAVEEKHIGLLDKVHNKLSEIAVKFANLQEKLGIGIGEILGFVGGASLPLLKSLLGRVLPTGTTLPPAGGILSGAWESVKGAGASAWSAVKGVGTKIAPIAGKATAGLAGVSMAYDGATDALDDKKSTVSRSLSALEAGAGVTALGSMAAGAGLLGTSAAATALGTLLLPALAVGGVAYGGKKLYEYLQEPENDKEKKYTPDTKLSDTENAGLKSYNNTNPELESLRKEVAQYKELVEKNKQEEKDETPALLLEEVVQIRAFLETWKDDNEKRSFLSETKDKYSLQSLFLRNYLNPNP